MRRNGLPNVMQCRSGRANTARASLVVRVFIKKQSKNHRPAIGFRMTFYRSPDKGWLIFYLQSMDVEAHSVQCRHAAFCAIVK